MVCWAMYIKYIYNGERRRDRKRKHEMKLKLSLFSLSILAGPIARSRFWLGKVGWLDGWEQRPRRLFCFHLFPLLLFYYYLLHTSDVPTHSSHMSIGTITNLLTERKEQIDIHRYLYISS